MSSTPTSSTRFSPRSGSTWRSSRLVEDTLATEVVASLDYFVLFRRSRLNEYEALGEYVQPGSDDDQSRGFYET
jgi:hypothetical protein